MIEAPWQSWHSVRARQAADIVIFSGDPLTVADDALSELRVEMTLVDAEVRFRAE